MPLFTQVEEDYLVDFYVKFRDVLDSTGRTAEFNKRRTESWDKLTRELNAMNPNVIKDARQVRDKLTSLRRTAKEKHANNQRELKKTGGGIPALKQLSPSEEKLVALLSHTANFCGIPGQMETGCHRLTTAEFDSSQQELEDVTPTTSHGLHPDHDSSIAEDIRSKLLY